MYLRMEPPNALAVFATMCLMLATIGRAEHCPLPGTECRPDGPWPQTKCTQLLNQTACEKAITTPTCNPKGCSTKPRCIWSHSNSNCSDPPPPPPPQPCAEITESVDCVWSLGRDCRWVDGKCTVPPPLPPLPACAADHSCAHNGLSTIPPMGWRSWNLFQGRNNQDTMMAMMAAFVDKSRKVDGEFTSLAEIGYLSVGMDDGYQLCNCSGSHGQLDTYPHSLYNVSCSGDNSGQEANACRDGRCTWHNQSDGTPMIDTLKFPDLKAMVKHGHALGLQIGFYLNNCICMEKGRTYFQQDVAFMHAIGFDTVKIDQCSSAMNMSLWAALINATGRPMMLENCHNRPNWWSPGQDAATTCDSNMWRSGGDIGNSFGSVWGEAHQWFSKNNLSASHPWGARPISRPGCWGYPDMMEIGNFCKDGPGENARCFAEERSHFGLWCVMSSPLVLGFNMSNQKQMSRVWPIITNREAIAIDQAWAGMPGTLFSTMHNKTVEIWAKALPDSKVAVLVLNTAVTPDPIPITLSLARDLPGHSRAHTARDIWRREDIVVKGGELRMSLATHDSMLLVLGQLEDNHWWEPKHD